MLLVDHPRRQRCIRSDLHNPEAVCLVPFFIVCVPCPLGSHLIVRAISIQRFWVQVTPCWWATCDLGEVQTEAQILCTSFPWQIILNTHFLFLWPTNPAYLARLHIEPFWFLGTMQLLNERLKVGHQLDAHLPLIFLCDAHRFSQQIQS